MSSLPVLLWSDALIWLLAAVLLGVLPSCNPTLRAAWRRVGRSRVGMAAATVLMPFILVELLDSIHYRPALDDHDQQTPDCLCYRSAFTARCRSHALAYAP